MYFKLVSKNAYRDLVRNARRICISDISDSEKREAFSELYGVLKDSLDETTRSLNDQPAYARRCDHWNESTIAQFKPVKNVRNPWLRFKREFVNALDARSASRSVEISLAWLYHEPHRDDWVK